MLVKMNVSVGLFWLILFLPFYSLAQIPDVSGTVSSDSVKQADTVAKHRDSMWVQGKKLFLGNKRIEQKVRLLQLIDAYPNPKTAAIMRADYFKMRRYQGNQRFFKLFFLPLGGIVQFYALLGSTTGEHAWSAGTGLRVFAAGLVFEATAITGSLINKHRRWKKVRTIAHAYNQP